MACMLGFCVLLVLSLNSAESAERPAPSETVQVWNVASSADWVSRNVLPNRGVRVTEKKKTQIWFIEKDSAQGLFSFYAIHDGQKLYLTYQKDRPKVRTEFLGYCRNRFFTLKISYNGKIYIKPKEDDRYLCAKRERLFLCPPGTQSKYIEWDIRKVNQSSIVRGDDYIRERKQRDFCDVTCYSETEVLNVDQTKLWIATGAIAGGDVKVEQRSSRSEAFNVTRHTEYGWSFSTLSTDGKRLFVTYTNGSDAVSYAPGGEGVNRDFIMIVAPTGGVYIKTMEDDKFLFNDNGKLALSPNTTTTPEMQWNLQTVCEPSRYNGDKAFLGDNLKQEPKRPEHLLENAVYNVEMLRKQYGTKWISSDARPDKRISVRPSTAINLWKMKIEIMSGKKIWTFYAIQQGQLFVTYYNLARKGLDLSDGNNAVSQSFFATDAGNSLMRFQRYYGDQYFVSVTANFLGLSQYVPAAAKWEAKIIQYVYQAPHCDAFVLPIAPFENNP